MKPLVELETTLLNEEQQLLLPECSIRQETPPAQESRQASSKWFRVRRYAKPENQINGKPERRCGHNRVGNL